MCRHAVAAVAEKRESGGNFVLLEQLAASSPASGAAMRYGEHSSIYWERQSRMAKPNYHHLKKQREAAKKREQQEKLAKRQRVPTTPETDPKSVP